MTDWFRALSAIVNRHEPPSDLRAMPRAAAALLLEMAASEEGLDTDELDVIHRAMQRGFALPTAELDELLAQAQMARKQSVSLYEFTESLRTGLQTAQRGDLIEWLWQVALADERLGAHEEHLLRKLADLLGVPHDEYIRRKLKVMGQHP